MLIFWSGIICTFQPSATAPVSARCCSASAATRRTTIAICIAALRARLAAAGLRVVDRHHAHGLHAPYWWLKCALGVNRSQSHPLVKAYHDVLVLEMTQNPLPLQVAERVLQPLIGKSLILYAVKEGSAS